MTARLYSAEEVQARLTEALPAWHLERGALTRRYATHGWKASLLVANAIGHLAELAWHHPDLLVSFGGVEVRLSSHDAGGITDLDFALAGKIEEVVLWRPAPPLSGTPSGDSGAAYLKR